MARRLVIVACLFAGRLFGVTVGVEDDCAGMGSVDWSERVVGDGTTKLTVKASAADGNSFCGWFVSAAEEVAWPVDERYAGSVTVTVPTSAVVTASFVAHPDDTLEFDFFDLSPYEIDYGEKAELKFEVDSVSFPTLSFTGLPAGVTYSSQKLTLSGTPSAPGVYHVKATGRNASGYSFQDFFTILVGNASGGRVFGEDVEIPLGEAYQAEFAESEFGEVSIFNCDEEWQKVELTGLPPGLTWQGDGEWELVSGTPTQTGDYTVAAKVTFLDGSSETATLVMSVVAPDPSEYGVDLDCLDMVSVGDEFDRESNLIAEYDAADDTSVVSVSGLPSGLSAKSWTEDGKRRWGIEGRAKKAGRHEISVKVSYDDGEDKIAVDTRRVVVVRDVPDVYLSVESVDATMGSVSGGGAVSPVAVVAIGAKANSGYVFAGWHDADGDRIVFDDGTDYREPAVMLSAETDFSLFSLRAHFVPKADDVAPEFVGLEGGTYSFAAGGALYETFEIECTSLPTLSFKGLPSGVVCEADGDGAFALKYDGGTVSRRPSPGRYSVTATATNKSGRKTSVSFLVVVANESDPRIKVADDYGELVPGEAIPAIHFDDAVDFAVGETLSVSGLPPGLKYNSKANAKSGVAANTITGTPTKPGYYTLVFTAKVVTSATTTAGGKVVYKYETAKATAFVTVLPYPELEIDVDESALAAGNKVSGGGNYKAGTKVTLKATAAKGWAFAGWDGLDDVDAMTLEALNPKLTYVTSSDDVYVYASFIEVRDDWLFIGEPALTDAGYAAEFALGEPVAETENETLVADLIDTGSWPTVKVSGLPKGLKFSSSTFMLSGKPAKSGVYHVTVSAKNASGYSFVRVLDFAVLNADGSLPKGDDLPNDAGMDFSPLGELISGVPCAEGMVALAVGSNSVTGAAVKKVATSGLPAGLVAASKIIGGEGVVEITGTPTKPGRQIVSVKVTYANGKSATSKCAVVVEDGGSYYLDVGTLLESGGTTSGAGVYASGAKVKLSAKPKSKHVFAGWFAAEGPFEALGTVEGVDYRKPSVSFTFRPDDDFAGDCTLGGDFVPSADDGDVSVDLEGATWLISPDEASEFGFAVESKSLPTLTAKGLPKGVTVDLARGRFSYAPTASTQPGIYTATLSAKNSTVKKAKQTTFEIRVANRVSDFIGGLDPDMDAYRISVGTTLPVGLIAPETDEEWKLSVKGLPSGLSYKGGVVVGAPKKAGVYTVTFTATIGKGAGKRTETATIIVRVQALPAEATGTMNGFLLDGEDVVGTVTVSVTAAGKVSAKAAVAAQSASFSANTWDLFENGEAEVSMAAKGDAELSVILDSTAEWTDWQLSGICRLAGKTYLVTGQRDPYGKNGVDEAKKAMSGLVGTAHCGGWTAKVSKDGTVKLSGKYNGKSVSGSVKMSYDGRCFAKLVKFIDKKSALVVTMWFDEDGTAVGCTTEER